MNYSIGKDTLHVIIIKKVYNGNTHCKSSRIKGTMKRIHKQKVNIILKLKTKIRKTFIAKCFRLLDSTIPHGSHVGNKCLRMDR